MPLPVQFLARLAVPLVATAIFLTGSGPEQTTLYDKILETSDKTLSIARGEGEGPTEVYDYIIVGAGSAGAVLANRLSASGSDSILVLEAGGDPNPISEIPYAAGFVWGSDMMLDYMSVLQDKACVVRTGGNCIFPRGRALGGSSAVNGLVYNRCNRNDFELWANFTGDPIWKFETVVEAYKSIESYHGFYEDNPGPNHGTDGEMYVGKIEFLPGLDILFRALEERGIAIGDLNSGELSSGFSTLDYNIKDGLRWNTYSAFLEPILNRTNLKIYRYAWATKVHLDANKRAVGVTYNRHGQSRYVEARKEIILSAGVIDSPKLLMLSGIGPADHLSQFGIETIVDLPAVGDHLQEHLGLSLPPFGLNQTIGIAQHLTPSTVHEFVENGTGPLNGFLWWGQFAPQIAVGYFSSKQYNNPDWPDLKVYVHEQLMTPSGKPQEEVIICDIEMVRTEQTGTVRLSSADPTARPVIDPRFMENPADIERYIEGIEYILDLFFNSTTYQALGIKWADNMQILPECSEFSFPSTEYWRCYVQMYTSTALHPTSTCRMGPNSDVAVVDSKLRVFGTTGLRIADSSVMVKVPNGNTNMPSMMIGEMASRIILGNL